MRRMLVAAIVAGALLAPTAASAVSSDEPGDSCFAMNPAQPKCTFTVTSTSTSGTVTGGVGAGEWVVVVKRGKAKMKFGPASSEPEPVSFAYQVGDKVTATVKSAGGWVLAGHD